MKRVLFVEKKMDAILNLTNLSHVTNVAPRILTRDPLGNICAKFQLFTTKKNELSLFATWLGDYTICGLKSG